MFDYKNASKVELKAQFQRIADKTGDDQFFTKKELRYLPQMLMDREQVVAFCSGMLDGNTWLIVLTDRRVLFLNKGILYGLKERSIPIDRINGVSGSTGMFFGEIVINDGFEARQIKQVSKRSVRPFINCLQEVMDGRYVTLNLT